MAQRMYKRYLSQIGQEKIILANNGQDALRKVSTSNNNEEASFDLVLCDSNMPEMDGMGFIKAMKENPESKNIPIIMVTTETEKEKIIEAVRNGVSHYIVKPFTQDTLKEKIEQIIESGR